MNGDAEFDGEIDLDALKNEFTGSRRESNLPPGLDEPVCLISYEITHILLGDGPQNRSTFWRAYRRELALNLETDYQNYHVQVCRDQLASLQMDLKVPVYFRNNRLTTEKQIDPYTIEALASPRFTYQKEQN